LKRLVDKGALGKPEEFNILQWIEAYNNKETSRSQRKDIGKKLKEAYAVNFLKFEESNKNTFMERARSSTGRGRSTTARLVS